MNGPYDAIRSQIEQLGLKKPDAYNPYSAGPKVYGGSSMSPNTGPVSDRSGYIQRDARAKAIRKALMHRLEANKNGQPFTYGSEGPI